MRLLLSEEWRREQGEPNDLDPDLFPRLQKFALAEAEELRELGRSWDLWDPDQLVDAWASILPLDGVETTP